ncbi:hypothetical protein [Streptomyces sp. NPDC004324]
MDPLTSAALRASGTITKAVLGRYRPVGVARVGSAEDRAHTYHRFLDGIAHAVDAQVLYFYRLHELVNSDEATNRQVEYRDEAWRRYAEARSDLHAALLGMRLCAPTPVLSAAETLMHSIPNSYDRDTDNLIPEEEFVDAHNRCGVAKAAFLEVARRDLAYDPRPWQLLRKRREREHRKRSEQISS